MLRTIILFTFITLLSTFGFAHDSNQAFFKINQVEQSIEIEAEFPWSIRNALIKFNPELENATSKEEFMTSLKKYLELNLILNSINGDQLELVQLKELNNSGHSHQSNYSLIYKGDNLELITNKLLFNMNEGQNNYHQINNNEYNLKFTTSPSQPTFKLPNTQALNYWYLTLVIPISILLLFLRNKSNLF